MSAPGRRGASAIEFALTLPVLLVIFATILDYGLLFSQLAGVVNAVRDGTRYAVSMSVDDPVSEAPARVEENLAGLDVPCDTSGGCEISAELTAVAGYQALHVRALVPYDPILGIVPLPERLSYDYTMLLEDQGS